LTGVDGGPGCDIKAADPGGERRKGRDMAKGQKRSGKEPRKPKAAVKKTNASNPSMKGLKTPDR
jgi:hypothetical protein